MDLFKEYLLQNWPLILILLAFVIMLIITVFLDRKTIMRMFLLIGAVFALSIIVFFEFYLAGKKTYPEVRKVLIAIRYSATPIIISLISYTLVKKSRWYIFLPALVLTIINIVSIFTDIVFGIDQNGEMTRGPLGYLPYIGVGVYAIFLVYILIRQSNKQVTEIIPIIFLVLAFASGLILPFFLGPDFSKIFCTTVAIALFVYYVFLILQLTKKDALTGLLNRQAYYASIDRNNKDITAFISIDMNGLKKINDSYGHIEGDNALVTLSICFLKAVKVRQYVYRIGGDEFMIICYKTNKDTLKKLVENIRKNVSHTKYSCSIGYSYIENGKSIEEMINESDEMMYKDKARFYADNDTVK